MTTPTANDYAAALATLSTMYVADGADVLEAALTYICARLAADVALLRAMADAERQADGRPSYPQPAGWAGRTR